MPAELSPSLSRFLSEVEQSCQQQQLIKLLLSKHRGEDKTLQRIMIRPVNLKGQSVLSFVYRYQTRDITKNYAPDDGIQHISELLLNDFKAAHLLTTHREIQLGISKKGKVSLHQHASKQVSDAQPDTQHNKNKKRFVELNRPYLSALGVTDQQHKLIPAMSRKWKQINKFIEVFSQAFELTSLPAEQTIQVVDFGSGKGYLTFAIHDYLYEQLHKPATVTGVELRQELAQLCNDAAQTLSHPGLSFVCGDVRTHAPRHTDVMIALHACDVATDYAIHYGITTGASIILCSPCCHKQIRPQMHSPELLQPMLQYGVHLGQQAEMVTDSLRALLLEAQGYQTKVFEFISLEHTNKNKMILATRRQKPVDNSKILQQIESIKSFYGIQQHCLETLLNDAPAESLN